MRTKQKGFSLIELLIVVAIILIIAAIAIPNLIRSKMAANEASAVASIRTVNTAEVVFSSTYNIPEVFAVKLVDLGDAAGNCANTAPTSTNACLIDQVLAKADAAPGKSGYLFPYTPPTTGAPVYAIEGHPSAPNSTGVRGFYSDQTLVIRANSPSPASVTSAPL